MIDTNEFYVDFKKEIQDIRQSLDAKAIAPPQALERQDVLASKCRHNLMYLPVRDQDTYNGDLRDLLTFIRIHATQSKAKFKFSHRKLTLKGDTKATKHMLTKGDTSQEEESCDIVSDFNDTFVSKPTNDHSVTKVKVFNISKSVVVMDQATYSTAEIDDISDSIIFLYRVNGPVYINCVTNSILVLACHQFRMHKSDSVSTFVSCSSKRPIIENCTSVTFGDFPDTGSFNSLVAWEAIDDFSNLSSDRVWTRKDNGEVKRAVERGLNKDDLVLLPSH
ncbi:tubulin binding cofactor C-domain-containing protein [Yarrowia lipolytica]|uniref:YALI0F14751p n=2 Tax=Yarrowia lipolytica TaxID=4952 RepID=Q6C1N5_YARLI|nr:YALI0F14751p [Yarrowia lipolytica CLIB122]AOW07190.1 hypothetical protein YALI1_F19717g [Yarrowia lipolytica]KAB8281709.1 tubulin binding cofactor C-domain-containing protein [Yarrowia lipolytica]KAE8171930.1 tubulin binding cofactor C-domain-containing protein [Yarrowia lipolytica]KAJ8055694.1 tubulin binding cofactor C-domain-containing protein [Yarrowia lipolytica]RDW28905.1 tubulin binding cofactor C-domain-containing protein [Yarrowia lipolytica]|eukprot:XP_505427.1 YALI0F14751p [Yarrowia lipolytica CLIB122]